MNKNEVWATLWNMRAGYIKANECRLATKGEFKKRNRSFGLCNKVFGKCKN